MMSDDQEMIDVGSPEGDPTTVDDDLAFNDGGAGVVNPGTSGTGIGGPQSGAGQGQGQPGSGLLQPPSGWRGIRGQSSAAAPLYGRDPGRAQSRPYEHLYQHFLATGQYLQDGRIVVLSGSPTQVTYDAFISVSGLLEPSSIAMTGTDGSIPIYTPVGHSSGSGRWQAASQSSFAQAGSSNTRIGSADDGTGSNAPPAPPAVAVPPNPHPNPADRDRMPYYDDSPPYQGESESQWRSRVENARAHLGILRKIPPPNGPKRDHGESSIAYQSRQDRWIKSWPSVDQDHQHMMDPRHQNHDPAYALRFYNDAAYRSQHNRIARQAGLDHRRAVDAAAGIQRVPTPPYPPEENDSELWDYEVYRSIFRTADIERQHRALRDEQNARTAANIQRPPPRFNRCLKCEQSNKNCDLDQTGGRCSRCREKGYACVDGTKDSRWRPPGLAAQERAEAANAAAGTTTTGTTVAGTPRRRGRPRRAARPSPQPRPRSASPLAPVDSFVRCQNCITHGRPCERLRPCRDCRDASIFETCDSEHHNNRWTPGVDIGANQFYQDILQRLQHQPVANTIGQAANDVQVAAQQNIVQQNVNDIHAAVQQTSHSYSLRSRTQQQSVQIGTGAGGRAPGRGPGRGRPRQDISPFQNIAGPSRNTADNNDDKPLQQSALPFRLQTRTHARTDIAHGHGGRPEPRRAEQELRNAAFSWGPPEELHDSQADEEMLDLHNDRYRDMSIFTADEGYDRFIRRGGFPRAPARSLADHFVIPNHDNTADYFSRDVAVAEGYPVVLQTAISFSDPLSFLGNLCDEWDNAFEDDRADFRTALCRRDHAKKCDCALDHHNPFCTCERCHAFQNQEFKPHQESLLQMKKSYLCRICADELTRRQMGRRYICYCSASERRAWFCHSHRNAILEQQTRVVTEVQQYLIEALGDQADVLCLGCQVRAQEPTTYVYGCKVCREWVNNTPIPGFSPRL